MESKDILYLGLLPCISLAINALVIFYAKRNALFVDSAHSSKPQRFHTLPTPRAGGISIFLSLVLFTLCAGHFSNFFLIFAGLFAFLSGILEDFRGTLSPKIRLLLQAFSAIGAIFLSDALITDLDIGWNLPWLLAFCFTIFAVVGSENAINIIDGFNGLASGIAMMVLLSLALAANSVGDSELIGLSLATFAAILGFFLLNFPKGKIFLGDGGAYFVGFMIVQIAILLSQRHEEVSAWFVLCVMIYPVYEVLFSAYRKKVVRGISPLEPDRYHLHMLLFRRLAHSNPKTSVFLWIFAAPFIFLPVFYPANAPLLILTILLFAALYHLLYLKLARRRARHHQCF